MSPSLTHALSGDDLLVLATDTLRDQPPFRSFMKQVSDHLHAEDLAGLTPASLVHALEDFWLWSRSVNGREVRIRPMGRADGDGRARLLLETTGPDIPFLVDSLQAELASQGIDILATLHPIVAGEHGPRSYIQFHLPALLPSEAERALASVRQTLADVSDATSDFQAMRSRMQHEARKVAMLGHLDKAARDEAYAFLTWLVDDHFVFLGSRVLRFRRDQNGEFLPEEPDMVEGSNLGLLRDESRNVLNAGSEPTVLTPEIGAFLREPSPIIIAKSDLFCRVHRRVFADYVGVKHYDEDGNVTGETRFAGLFTSEAYTEPTSHVPMIRRKTANVIARSDTVPGSHNAKALSHILESYPRDELFQIGEDQLLDVSLAILHLQGRPRPAVFLRRDRFDRFVTALLYVPRESYNAELRARIGEHIRAAFGGRMTAYYPRFGDGALARVHYHIALEPGHPEPDIDALMREVAHLSRSWEDRFRTALDGARLDDHEITAALTFRSAFNAGYRETFSAEESITDVLEIAALSPSAPVRMRTYTNPGDEPSTVRAKIYARSYPLPLSRCVPVMENLGLFVAFETGYPVRPIGLQDPNAVDTYWIHAFTMRSASGHAVDIADVKEALSEAFVAVWNDLTENDAFNRLILAIGADWREAALVRALCRYRRQTGLDPAEDVQVRALTTHAHVTTDILTLFQTRLNPASSESLDARRDASAVINARIEEALKAVASLDEDRVLRRLANLVNAIQRTNFYHPPHNGIINPVISFKVASAEIEALPQPRPYREIFVASPQVEGIHLRFGPVARGGLRWSDRRDDFRTEVLGLVKAQQVKNAVIVPVGAKGGFFPKQLPVGGDREAVFNAGKAAYETFVSSLLDITDNIEGGQTTHPENTVIWDGEDPYLVVAADKGTATFSDTANGISVRHGHWLGDAFASGGSAGYDHKKMGITARGAWEAVKRHFREIGKDIQSEPFSVIGVGDMAGDVFGNGMLLSRQIRLIGAFNHMHIFVDPEPSDLEASWAERKRLFDMPRSTWDDYERSLISEGGGIFSRSAKSITLTPQIRKITGLSGDSVTPDELIAAILRAECELLWFGGIGTFVKAATETHQKVSDKANDAVRADAAEIRAKVIGEGANLGITQAGRIAFARLGGRINTDAIDNSAGVDSSDHEVNIKILLTGAIREGSLRAEDRDALLAEMTDEVAAHVLAHNYSQTSALTMAESTAGTDHEALERLMVWLEGRGVLNRDVEGLPTTIQMNERQTAGAPLTRPELAVLLAWSKIVLFDDLVASDLPDDPFLMGTLRDYFPSALHRFETARNNHRLKREIISTVIANRMLDRIGPATLQRLREATGAGDAALTRAFILASTLLEAEALEADIASLDNIVAAQEQTVMRHELVNALFHLTARFAETAKGETLDQMFARYGEAFGRMRREPRMISTPYATARRERRVKSLVRAGVPQELAERATAVRPLIQAPHVINLIEETGRPLEACAAVFTGAGEALSLDRLRVAADEALAAMPFWDRVATRRFIADLMAQQMRLARAAFRASPAETGDPLGSWLAPRETDREKLVEGIRAKGEGGWTFAKFALAADDIRRFMDNGGDV